MAATAQGAVASELEILLRDAREGLQIRQAKDQRTGGADAQIIEAAPI